MKLMRYAAIFLMCILFIAPGGGKEIYKGKIFDVHLHYPGNVMRQFKEFKKHNIVRGAVSTSWDKLERYRTSKNPEFLIGLMFPCPNGIVPYSGQKCFKDGKEFPDTAWVRKQIVEGKIDFLGELLNEYYGISPSDSIMFPYYALAREFNLPVGIHTGLAGPGNLCPDYDSTMGNPVLLKKALTKFPGLKIWIMHAGGPYIKGTLEILRDFPQVYADISVIANPDIVPKTDFTTSMKQLIEAGFENRLMFGSDDGNYDKMIKAVNGLDFLTYKQKEKIFYQNAVRFFDEE